MGELKDKPIGVFDSGLGGLTVVRAIQRLLPDERIVYLGDSARVPYGTRSESTVITYARKCAQFLIDEGLKMLVVACNTASSVALPALRTDTDLPVLGVITAGAKAVVDTGAKRVGVIGTTGTVNSRAYIREIAAAVPDCAVVQEPAPLLVPLAEEGWIDGQVPLLAATRYLEPLVKENIEVLLLGCTHYPLLKGVIGEALANLGSRAAVIDSATAMASAVKCTLDGQGRFRTPGAGGGLDCYVTDLPASFEQVASRFLGSGLDQVKKIDII
jgi:glutamate racemase